MIIAVHKNARAIRAEIAASSDAAAVLAARYGVGEGTIRRWKSRSVFTDASHTAYRLQTTLTLTPAQEAVVVKLRNTLLLPLDDLLAICREFICAHVSRSGLDRCLRRHVVGKLKALLPAAPKEPAKACEPGYLYVDVKYLPQMADETSRSYLFVAIDRSTRWVFVQIKRNKTAANAKAFLNTLHKACPIVITKVLKDNARSSPIGCLPAGPKNPAASMSLTGCASIWRLEHRLTKPRTPPGQRHGEALQWAHWRCSRPNASTRHKRCARRSSAMCICTTSSCRSRRCSQERRCSK